MKLEVTTEFTVHWQEVQPRVVRQVYNAVLTELLLYSNTPHSSGESFAFLVHLAVEAIYLIRPHHFLVHVQMNSNICPCSTPGHTPSFLHNTQRPYSTFPFSLLMCCSFDEQFNPYELNSVLIGYKMQPMETEMCWWACAQKTLCSKIRLYFCLGLRGTT